MKKFITINDFAKELDYKDPQNTYIKRVRKGGGAFPYVLMFAMFKDGVYHGVTFKFVKYADSTDRTNYDYVCDSAPIPFTQTTIQKTFLVEDFKNYIEENGL